LFALTAVVPVIAATVVAGAAAQHSAQDLPLGSSEPLELVGQIGGAAWSGEVVGDMALIGVGPRLVSAALPDPDIDDSLFEEVSRSPILPDLVTAVTVDVGTVDAGTAYVSLYDWGVAVVDLGSGLAPGGQIEVLGSVRLLGEVGAVAVKDSMAYVASANDGVRVVDARDPRALREVPFGDGPDAGARLGYTRDVAVTGHHLLVACGGSFDRPWPGLRVVDLAEQGTRPEIADLITPGEAEIVVAAGQWAYVVHAGPEDNDRQALWVVDLSDPREPRMVSEVLLTDLVWDLAVDGDRLYIAADEYGVIAYDVRDPETPRLLGFVDTGLAHGVRAEGDRLIVFAGGGPVRSYDMRAPREPRQMQAFHTVGQTADVVRRGAELLVAEWSHWPGGAMRVLDTHDASDPVLVHSVHLEQWQEAIAGTPGAAYVGGYDSVLRVFDRPEEGAPSLQASVNANAVIMDLAVRDALVFAALARGSSGALWIVDVSEPSAPTEVGRVLIEDAAFGLHVEDGLAYVAAESAGLLLVDTSDPSGASIVGSLSGIGRARGVAVHGGYAFVATDDSGMAVVNVERPDAPLLVAQLPHQRGMGSAQDIVTDGSAAYLAATETGVAVVDVRRPSSPLLVGTYDTPGIAWSVAISGSTLYAADEAGGVLAYRRMPLGPTPTAGPPPTATTRPSETPSDPTTPVATATAPTLTATAPVATATAPVATATKPTVTATATPGVQSGRLLVPMARNGG
jgi:hypothetical protein